jgi:putative ABC transport system permease protein
VRFFTAVMQIAVGNWTDRPGRGLCLVGSVGVTVAACLLLAALYSPNAPSDIASRSVLVTNIRSGGSLPVRYVRQIEQLPLTQHSVYVSPLPLTCKPGITASVNAYAGEGVDWLLVNDYGIAASALAAWNGELTGLLVGVRLARLCGWSDGMRVRPVSPFTGLPVDVRIVGIIPEQPTDPYLANVALAHQEYVNRLEGIGQKNQVIGIVAYAENAGKTGALAARIDEIFSGGDPPTQTMVNTEGQTGLREFGNIRLVLQWVMIAILACSMLVVVSVMAHASAHRRGTFGLLIALGFSRIQVACAYAAEFFVLILTGAMVGLVSGWVLIRAFSPMLSMIVGNYEMPAGAAGLFAACSIGFLACGMLVPSYAVFRARAIDVCGSEA